MTGSIRDRTLALAGLFQATELVRQAASHGTWSGYAASCCLGSLFRFEAPATEEVYGGTKRLRLGVETLLAIMQGDAHHNDTLRYAIGVLQIEKRFRRSAAVQERVGSDLQRIGALGQDLEQHEREDLQAREISQLYAQTISQLGPRVVVNGKPQYLKNDRTVTWVRTLLLAGLRSALLWRQLGGGRMELMFGRKRILREAQSFLMG